MRKTQLTLHTPLCDLLGVRHPIVQTGMGFVSDATLTAATSAAGGLGILAGAMMDRAELQRAIAQIKERTSEPFGVNLRADHADVEALIDVLIGEHVKVASFALAPRGELIAKLKDAGVVVIPSIGARRHAEKVAALGRRRRRRAGRRGRRPHRRSADEPARPAGRRRGRDPRDRRRRLLRRPRPRRGARLRRVGDRDGHALPADAARAPSPMRSSGATSRPP